MPLPARSDWSERLSRLQRTCRDRGLDGLVISSLVNIRYLTGFTGTAALVIVTPTETTLLTDGRYTQAVKDGLASGTLAPVTPLLVAGGYDRALAQFLANARIGRVGFEAAHTWVATLDRWKAAAVRASVPVEWEGALDVVESLRLIKSADELVVLRRGGQAIAGVARALATLIRPDRTEREVADAVDSAMKHAGFSTLAFPTIVASGPNSALPHARPTDRHLAPGDLVLVDFGGVLDGYCVDLTRMAVVGHVTPEAGRLFAAVQSAHTAALAAVGPGRWTWEIDEAARGALDARGLGEAFVHATGHGLGLDVHEAPRIGKRDPEVPDDPAAHARLEAGMVFTIEPGAYLEGVGGVRLEDDVLVTPVGSEVLTDAPRDLLVV